MQYSFNFGFHNIYELSFIHQMLFQYLHWNYPIIWRLNRNTGLWLKFVQQKRLCLLNRSLNTLSTTVAAARQCWNSCKKIYHQLTRSSACDIKFDTCIYAVCSLPQAQTHTNTHSEFTIQIFFKQAACDNRNRTHNLLQFDDISKGTLQWKWLY